MSDPANQAPPVPRSTIPGRSQWSALDPCPVCLGFPDNPDRSRDCRGFWVTESESAFCTTGEPGPNPDEVAMGGRLHLVDVTCPCGQDHRGDGAEGLTDWGNARRLARMHGSDWRHVKLWGGFLRYDGARWSKDDTEEVMAFARDVPRDLWRELSDMRNGEWKAYRQYAHGPKTENPGEPEFRAAVKGAFKDWARTSEARPRLDACVGLFKSEPRIGRLPTDFDADPWLLNVKNGTLDLRTGTLRPHDRADHCTRLAPVEWQGLDAPAPLWEAFLDRVLPQGPALQGFVRRLTGYACLGVVEEHVLAFLYGTGRNGKGVFLETVMGTLGDYADTTDPMLLLATQNEQHPTAMADLKGKRLVVCSEIGPLRRLDEAKLKSLTGGDTLKARFMRQDFFWFTPSHTIFVAANHQPAVWDHSEAFWQRVKLIPFVVYIPPSERDLKLKQKLLAEAPGILAWLVRGCLEWQQQGLNEPAEVTAATARWREDTDLLGPFLAECCVLEPGAQAPQAAIQKAYAEWARVTSAPPLSAGRLNSLLEERGLTGRTVRGRKIRVGIGLVGELQQGMLAEELPVDDELERLNALVQEPD